jgi:hypothetical protein
MLQLARRLAGVGRHGKDIVHLSLVIDDCVVPDPDRRRLVCDPAMNSGPVVTEPLQLRWPRPVRVSPVHVDVLCL